MFDISKKDFIQIVARCNSKCEIQRELKLLGLKGIHRENIRIYIKQNNIDISHFDIAKNRVQAVINKGLILPIDTEEFIKIVQTEVSVRAIYRSLKNQGIEMDRHKIKRVIKELNLDTSHFFDIHALKYPHITKICPACGDTFTTQKGHHQEKTTCSHKCATIFLKTGNKNHNYKDGSSSYKRLCYSIYPKKCIICGFDIVLDVHHIDENHKNNTIENLVPLCPNHHKLIHSKKYQEETKLELAEKIAQFNKEKDNV